MIIYEVYFDVGNSTIMRDTFAHSAEDAIALLLNEYPFSVLFVYNRLQDLVFDPETKTERARTDADDIPGTQRIAPPGKRPVPKKREEMMAKKDAARKKVEEKLKDRPGSARPPR